MTAGLAPQVGKTSLHRADKAFLGGAAAALDRIDYFDGETAEPHADSTDFAVNSRPGAGGHVAGIGTGPDRDPDQDTVGRTLDELVLPQARYSVQRRRSRWKSSSCGH
jgi:hypothetical protein